MSTLVLIDPESSTQADGAQISRVPVPLLKDPYEAIRQVYLDGTDTKSESFEDPINTETPELPLTITPPISLSESTPPVLVPILRKTARMAVCVPPAMSSGLSASMAEVAAMSESAFLEDSEEDVDEEDEEIDESMDSDIVSEDAVDEGPTVEDEDLAAGDEGLTAGVESPGMDDESYGLDDESHGIDDESRGLDDEGHGVESDRLSMEEEEEVVPGGQPQEAPVVRTAMSASLGLGVSASRQPTLTTWTGPEDGLLPISPSPFVVPSPVSSPMIPLTVPSPVATPATAETEGFLTELRAQVEMQRGLIRNHAVRLEEL
ncbi:hypothetical protein Tco_0602993 [Tanacetum coccineum]